MTLENAACPICGETTDYSILYPANFKNSDLNIKVFSARRLPDKIHYQIIRCQKCSLTRSSPLAPSTKLSKLYFDSRFTYSEEVNNLATTYLKVLEPVLSKLSKSANILEIGCGNGFILEKLYYRGFKNVYGLEPSLDAYKKAKPLIKNRITQNILRPKIFPALKFDIIFIFQTFDHIPDPNQFLKECLRILRPGAYFLAFNHNIESLTAKIFKEKSPIIDIEHTFLYSPRTISEILSKQGFRIIYITSPASDVSLRHLIWLLPFPARLKNTLLNSKISKLNLNLKVRLGNLCVVAQKAKSW